MKRRREVVEALVLWRRSVGECDRWVTFLTREHGLLTAMAKGVRKMPSRRGGHLEPGTRVLAVLHESRHGWYVGAVETDEYFSALHNDPEALASAARVLDVLRALFSELDGHGETLYELVEWLWCRLPGVPAQRRALLEGAGLLTMTRMAGLLPDLSACRQCGNRVPQEALLLSRESEGWHCLSHEGSLQAAKHSLPAPILKLLRALSTKPAMAARLVLDGLYEQQVAFVARQLAREAVRSTSYYQKEAL